MGVKAPEHDTSTPRPPQGHDAGAGRLRLAGAAVLLGVFMIHDSLVGSTPPAPPPSAAAPATSAPAVSGRAPVPPSYAPTPSRPPTGPSLPPSTPTHLTIPRIRVSAPFTKLALDKSGVLQPPPSTNNNLVGWYGGGATPGELGTAVVLGHVDTKRGVAVFWLLGTLKKKDKIEIKRADGKVATFTVDSVELFSKDKFPDNRVYADTPDAELRLITCGGSYDHKRRDYTANVVVFAHLSSSTGA